MNDQDFNEFLLESILERKDIIPGGLADEADPSDFDQEQLKMGIEAELEHTNDRQMALEIAMDHLKEDPKYYTKLKKIEESHWNQRKTSNGKKAVDKEYKQHKKRRNATGAARDQDKRNRATKRGKAKAAARDEVRRKKEQGKLKEPKSCPICGKSPGTTSNGMTNMIFDHDKGYGEGSQTSGRWMCRTCHNKKDNNKPGDKSVKGKRRSKGLGSISKSSGDKHIKRAGTTSESLTKKQMIRIIADNMFTLE